MHLLPRSTVYLMSCCIFSFSGHTMHPVSSSFSSVDGRRTLSSVDPSLLFTSWSDAYYPEADRLSAYLQHWAGLPQPGQSLKGLGRHAPLHIV
jgi:hypothetical protein